MCKQADYCPIFGWTKYSRVVLHATVYNTSLFTLGAYPLLDALLKKKQNLFSLLSFLSLCIFPFSCLLSLFLFSLSWNVRGGDNRCLTKFTLQINSQGFTHTNTLESNFLNLTKYLCSLSLLEEQHLTRHFTNCEGRFFYVTGTEKAYAKATPGHPHPTSFHSTHFFRNILQDGTLRGERRQGGTNQRNQDSPLLLLCSVGMCIASW